MAEKIKYSRKDLKGPDEFISAFSSAVAWARENRTKLLAAAGGVMLLVVAVFGARAYVRWQESRASRDLWPQWNREVANLAVPSPSAEADLPRLEQFLTKQVERHPGTRAALYARYYLGSIAFLRGEYELAAKQYRAAIGEGEADGIMPFLLRQGLGQALEARGDFASASDAYRDAAAGGSGELQAQARLAQARTLALSGRKQEAAALYRQVLTETADARTKELIEIKLAQTD